MTDTDIDLNEVTNRIIEEAKRLFLRDGKLEPMAFLVIQAGGSFIIPLDFSDVSTKQAEIWRLRAICKETRPILLVLASEAWFATAQSDDPRIGAESLEHWPERKECLSFAVETPSSSKNGTIPILRDENLVRLGELEWLAGEMESDSRFFGMLPKETHQ